MKIPDNFKIQLGFLVLTKKTKTFKRQKKDVREEEEEKATRVKTVCQWQEGKRPGRNGWHWAPLPLEDREGL